MAGTLALDPVPFSAPAFPRVPRQDRCGRSPLQEGAELPPSTTCRWARRRHSPTILCGRSALSKHGAGTAYPVTRSWRQP